MKKKIILADGITLISVVISIIILIILAGVGIYTGKGVIQEAKLEELKTAMLLIQAKSKEYVEQANFKMGVNPEQKPEDEKKSIRQEIYEQEAMLEKASDIPSKFKVTNNDTCYWLTDKAEKNWGLDTKDIDESERGRYLIEFDEVNETVEVYNTLGYDGKYSLAEIKEIEK